MKAKLWQLLTTLLQRSCVYPCPHCGGDPGADPIYCRTCGRSRD